MIKSHVYPLIGNWYWDETLKKPFEIVAIDEASRCLELQYFTGEIEEINLDDWFAAPIVSIAIPQDWSGPYEMDKDQRSDLSD